MVLVGGQGTRLRPLTFTTPKQMLPVGGLPLIERVLGQLARHGIAEVVLALGYRPDAFLAAYPDRRCGGVSLHCAVEDEPLDTAGAVAFAARAAGIDDTFVVVNGDVLSDLDIRSLIAFHRREGAAGTIALTPVADPSAFGVVPTDGTGRVTAFIEKPPAGEAPTNLINAGTYVLEPAVLDRVPRGARMSIERELFPALVAERSLYAMRSEGDWTDVGTPETYLSANLRYAADGGASGEGQVHSSVVGTGVEVAAGATVLGSVLFDGVRVERGAMVRSSILGRGVVVGAGATVERLSIVGDGTAVPPGANVSCARLTSVLT